MSVFEYLRRLRQGSEELRRELERELWEEKVEGLIPVRVLDESEAIEFHILISWNKESVEWCEENCKDHYVFGHFSYNGPFVYFKSEEDAAAFKLRWM